MEATEIFAVLLCSTFTVSVLFSFIKLVSNKGG